MPHKGYDIFFMEPDAEGEMFCKVCNTRCEVERSVIEPTSMAESLAGRGHWHDRFLCPNMGQPWHDRALKIYLKIEETPSDRVRALMQQDLDEILLEHGCYTSREQADVSEGSAEPIDRDEIIQNGVVVYSYFWDSGGPGAGAEYEYIYAYHGKFYPVLSYEDKLDGYDSLEKALIDSELLKVTEACQEIEAHTIPAENLIPRLRYLGEEEIIIKINGVSFLINKNGQFVKQ